MAQFYDIFSSYSEGDFLTQSVDYHSEYSPEIDASSRLELTTPIAGGGGVEVLYSGISSSTTIEVFCKASKSARPGVCLFNSTDVTGSYAGYASGKVNDSNTELFFIEDGGSSALVNGINDGVPSFGGGEVFIRMRVESPTGSSKLIKYKAWASGDSEPVDWLAEYTATGGNYTSGDFYAGIFLRGFQNTSTYTFEFGIGTDGDDAPTEPVTPGGATVDAITYNAEFAYNAATIATGAVVSAETYSSEFAYFDATVATGAQISADAYSFESQYFDATITTGAAVQAETYLSDFNYYDGVAASGAAVNAETILAEFAYFDASIDSGATVSAEAYLSEFFYFDAQVATGAVIEAETYASEFIYYDGDISQGATVQAETYVADFAYLDGTANTGAIVDGETYDAEFAYFDGSVTQGASISAETYFAQFAYYDADVTSGATIQAETYQFQSQYYDGTVTIGEPVVFVKTIELTGLYRKNVTLVGNYRKRIDL